MTAKPVSAAMGALFIATCSWLYGPGFFSVLHSDVAVNVLMAARELATRSPVVRDFYFANGDVWMLDPHQFAVPLVALFGAGTTTLRLMMIVSIVAELAVLYASFLQITARREVALLGAFATLALWSRLSALFVYVEPSYGFLATVYFTSFALAAPGTRGRSRDIATAVWICLFTLQNPQRAGVFIMAPLVVASLWPWRGLAKRARALTMGAIAIGFVAAAIVYRTILRPGTITCLPLQHHSFAFREAAGIENNVRLIARGILIIAGDSPTVGVGGIAGLVVILGAIAFIGREVFSSREATARRFACVAALAQTGAVLLLLVVGDLLVDERSVRYLMPSLLVLLGLGAVVAADTRRRASSAWLLVMPVAVALSFLRMVTDGIASPADAWAENRDARRVLADELVRRDLKRGFAGYWNANILTLLSGGRTRACSTFFEANLVPQKWNTDATCFDPRDIPERFYVAASAAERDRGAIAKMAPSLPPPIETFEVAGGAFTVNVYETARTDMQWLDLPLPDAEVMHFPFVLNASHPAFRHEKGIAEGPAVIATGDTGFVVFGPFIDLPKGRLSIRWSGRGVDSPGSITFDVKAWDQPQPLAFVETSARALSREAGSTLAMLEIDLAALTQGIELRVFSKDGSRVVLEKVTIERR